MRVPYKVDIRIWEMRISSRASRPPATGEWSAFGKFRSRPPATGEWSAFGKCGSRPRWSAAGDSRVVRISQMRVCYDLIRVYEMLKLRISSSGELRAATTLRTKWTPQIASVTPSSFPAMNDRAEQLRPSPPAYSMWRRQWYILAVLAFPWLSSVRPPHSGSNYGVTLLPRCLGGGSRSFTRSRLLAFSDSKSTNRRAQPSTHVVDNRRLVASASTHVVDQPFSYSKSSRHIAVSSAPATPSLAVASAPPSPSGLRRRSSSKKLPRLAVSSAPATPSLAVASAPPSPSVVRRRSSLLQFCPAAQVDMVEFGQEEIILKS
nr:hypothetical protein Iba_chr02eCG5620 [Ipomoea batatas]